MEAETKEITARLQRLAQSSDAGLLQSLSVAMGSIYGIAFYYKTIGLKRQGAQVLNGAAEFIGE